MEDALGKMIAYERTGTDDGEIRRRVGLMLKHRREKCGLYQDDLAKAWKVSRQTICHIETGRSLSYTRLLKIADFLELTVDELLRGDPEHAA